MCVNWFWWPTWNIDKCLSQPCDYTNCINTSSLFCFVSFCLGPTRSLRKRGQQQTSASQKTRQKKKPITYQKQKNTSKRKSDVDQASRGSQTDSEECESQSPKQKKLQQSDSGMFISPFGNRPLPKLPKMNASDTSTPSSIVHGKSLDDSCFGFDHIMSPQGLPLSPVESMSPLDDGHRPGSSMSGMSSLQGSISSGTSSMLSPPKRKYNTVNLSGLIPGEAGQSEMPVAKKTKKKKIPVSLFKLFLLFAPSLFPLSLNTLMNVLAVYVLDCLESD